MEISKYCFSKRSENYQNLTDTQSLDKPRYCPFRTPIVKSKIDDTPLPLKSRRVLFEETEDEETVLNSVDINILRNQ